jgi:hypothetical protein
VAIVLAARRAEVEQLAGDVGRIDLAGVLVLDLVQAALAAAVAERFPFGAIESLERKLPEFSPPARGRGRGRVCRLAANGR